MVSFNRTIVELKYNHTRNIREKFGSFNRTIVELKFQFIAVMRVERELLIVP